MNLVFVAVAFASMADKCSCLIGIRAIHGARCWRRAYTDVFTAGHGNKHRIDVWRHCHAPLAPAMPNIEQFNGTAMAFDIEFRN